MADLLGVRLEALEETFPASDPISPFVPAVKDEDTQEHRDVANAHSDHAKVGILCGSLLAAIVGAALIAPRNRKYKAMRAAGHDPDTLD